MHTSLYPHGDLPIDFSQAAFRRLLANATHLLTKTSTLYDSHVRDIVRFLQHELNHDSAGNIKAYYTWLKDRHVSTSVLTTFATMLRDKIALANIPQSEVRAIVKDMSGAMLAPRSREAHVLTHAYLIIAPAMLEKLPFHNKTTQRYNSCLALIQGLSALPPSPDVARLILDTYSALSFSHQGHMTPLIAQCLLHWLRHFPIEQDGNTLNAIFQILDHINPRRVENLVINATARLMTDDAISQDHRKALVPYWLYILRRSQALGNKPWDHHVWSDIYECLFDKLSPVDMDAHLTALGPIDAARIILNHCIRPRIIKDIRLPKLKTLSLPSPRAEDAAVSYTVSHSISRHDPGGGSWADRLAKTSESSTPDARSEMRETSNYESLPTPELLFENINAAFEARLAAYNPDHPPQIAPFADLVGALHEHSQPYDHILNDIMMLLVQNQTMTRIFTMTMTLVRESIHVPPAIALPLIKLMVDTKNPGYALRIFQACGDVWPSLCPELIFALIENGPVLTTSLFDILNRAEYSNSLPVALRSERMNTLSEQRVHLIHHMMYALAVSPHLTSRQAFRRVHDCLRYLHTRGAPLSSLVSRALVQSGIIRPLQEGNWVSTVKFVWILDYVKKYEGTHVAGLLDKIAFEWRSNNADKSALRDRVMHLYKQKEVADFQYRLTLGHASHRWKRRTGQWKPWLAEKGCLIKDKSEEVRPRVARAEGSDA